MSSEQRKRNRGEQFYSIKIINIGQESLLTFKFSELEKTRAAVFLSVPYFCQKFKNFSLTNAIFSEFLDERFLMTKSNCIFIFTFLYDVTLHGKIPKRLILGVSTPGI